VFTLDGLGIVGILLLGLWIYCIFDVIASDQATIRNLPKGMWLVIVLILPDIGSIAWLLLGRPEKAGWRPGDPSIRFPRPRAVGPEDRSDFIARMEARDRLLAAWAEEDRTKAIDKPTGSAPTEQERARLAAWEADLARREAELRPTDGPTGESEG
jgi:Phospholipase_D-nuclease N-terminal